MNFQTGVTQTFLSHLPKAGRQLLRPLPHKLIEKLLERECNRALAAPLSEGELVFLSDRCVLVQVTDLDFRFFVRLQDGRLRISLKTMPAQVSFKAKLADLLVLMGGLQDPDTLFFRRQLIITGDTELALQIKNLLDQLEPQILFAPLVFKAIHYLGKAHLAQTHRYAGEKSPHIPVKQAVYGEAPCTE